MKTYEGIKLAQIERRAAELKAVKAASTTSNGWVRLVRKIMGMNMETLAQMLSIDQSTLARLEKREANKKITLEKLNEVAKALDCELVYALVPRTTFKEKIEAQATIKAKKLLKKAGTHMELENQVVQSSYTERLDLLKDELIKNGDIW